MTLTVFFILLFAALLHASWNAIVKAGSDKLSAAISVTGSAALIAALILPFSPQPTFASAPWLAASCILQVFYTLLVAKTYQIADMGQTYPLMRGTAPLLVACATFLLPGEHLSALAWAGIAVICVSIMLMAMQRHGGSRSGVLLALLNACFIAGYTLVDGTGVRLAASALGYTLWTFLLNGCCMLAWRKRGLSCYLLHHWKKGLFGGIGTLGSYGLALWAMTQAPLAVVAALRETSILFGAVIAVVVLKERPSSLRIIAALGIACGAVLLRLA